MLYFTLCVTNYHRLVKMKRRHVLALVFVLVVLIGCAVYWVSLQKSQPDTTTPTTSTSTTTSSTATYDSGQTPDAAIGTLSSYLFTQGANNYAPYSMNETRLPSTASAEELATHCDKTIGCVAFNHRGYMMNDKAHHPEASWQENPHFGLWIKK